MSEPNGEFQSDNFLSNERGYQVVIPDLVQTAKPGRVYLGVGPEQNFPYIVALKPAMAIIFDVRRGNLHEQLLYKALFEMSADRADFLSRLFSRKRPDGLTASSSVNALMDAYDKVDAERRAVPGEFHGGQRLAHEEARLRAARGRPGRHRLRLPHRVLRRRTAALLQHGRARRAGHVRRPRQPGAPTRTFRRSTTAAA